MDNESIIIGGLLSLDKKKVEHRVPFFSSIPFIGERFFRHSSEIESKTDLVIQITPKIIYDNYSGINKNQFHKETENESKSYGLDVDDKKMLKKTKSLTKRKRKSNL